MSLTRMMPAGLTVLLLVNSFVTAQPAVPPTLEDIQKQLTSIQTDLKNLQPLEISKKLGEFDLRLRKLEEAAARSDSIRTTSQFLSTDPDNIRMEIRSYLRNLDERVRRVEEPRVARSFSPLTSSIRLENRSLNAGTVYVNDVAYPLEPGEIRTLRNQLPGPYTYDVSVEGYTRRVMRTRNLPAGGYTDIITILPE